MFLLGVTPSFADNEKVSGGLSPSAEISWDDAPSVEATSAIVMDAGSGEILYEKNAYERRDPASVTKMLTCLVILETMDLDQQLTVSYDILNEGTNMELKKGETLTVEQLLYGLMLASANDAAEFLAISAGGSIDNFSDMMNERAARCGAESTTFTNPNGLNNPGQENHKTTAYDLAMIAREAMKNETFRTIVSTKKYTIPATNKSEQRKLRNTNACLVGTDELVEIDGRQRPYKYEGTLGIKTGYTSTAGNCFCGWVQREDTNLVSVVLNSSSYETRFGDTIKLWDYTLSNYHTYVAARAGKALDEFKIKRGEQRRIKVAIEEDLAITLNNGDNGAGITTQMEMIGRKIIAPVKKGDEVGTITAYKDGKPVAKASLVSMETVEKGWIFSYIGIPDEDKLPFLLGTAAVIIALLFIKRTYERSRRKRRLRRRARRSRNARRKEWEREKNPFDYYDNFRDFK